VFDCSGNLCSNSPPMCSTFFLNGRPIMIGYSSWCFYCSFFFLSWLSFIWTMFFSALNIVISLDFIRLEYLLWGVPYSQHHVFLDLDFIRKSVCLSSWLLCCRPTSILCPKKCFLRVDYTHPASLARIISINQHIYLNITATVADFKTQTRISSILK